MAHNLADNSIGGKSFYSLRQSGWHNLGNVVDAPVSDERCAQLAGVDWDVNLQPLLRDDMVAIESHMATVRSDNGATLGVVGRNYTPMQNRDMFAWFRGLEGVAKITIETAGALGKGETVWAMARCDGLRLDLGDGGIQPYLLFANGHDGSRRVTIMPTTVRVVCQNTLRMAEGAGKRKGTLSSGYALRHTSGIADALASIQKAYAKTSEAWKRTEEALRFLASRRITNEGLQRLFTEPWIPKKAEVKNLITGEVLSTVVEDKDEGVRALAIRQARERRLNELLVSPTCKIGKLGDTWYAAVQAVTEYLDHEAVTRGENDREKAMRRLESANFGGTSDEVKGRAWDLALDLAGA
jgi:phage/plasmid-like protein (TIGR03299 family)